MSRPLTRSRAGGAHGPWIALATGFNSGGWVLAERTLLLPALRALIAHAQASMQLLEYAWLPAQTSGLFRKTARVLRAAVSPTGFEDVPPPLFQTLTLTLLLRPDAITSAMVQLGSSSLLVAPRWPHDLFVAAGGVTDFTEIENLFRFAYGPAGEQEDKIYHLSLSAHQTGLIVGEMFRRRKEQSYSLAAQDQGAWLLGNEVEEMGPDLDDYQMELIHLVFRRGAASYRQIDMWMTVSAPNSGRRIPSEVAQLAELGLVFATPSAKDPGAKWALTAKGLRIMGVCDEAEIVEAELDQILSALRTGFEAAVKATMNMGPRMARAPVLLVWAAQHDPSVTCDAVTLVCSLDRSEMRDQLVETLFEDAEPAVRAGVLKAIAPHRPTVPGDGTPLLGQEKIADLARRGIADADARVRGYSAKVAYSFNCAGPIAAQIVRHVSSLPQTPLSDDEERLGYYSVLALGACRDAESLTLLERLLDGPDDLGAVAAARALSLRPDGRRTWLSLFSHPRRGLRETAIEMLRHAVVGLSDVDIVTIINASAPRTKDAAGDPKPQMLNLSDDVREALAAYGRRTRSR